MLTRWKTTAGYRIRLRERPHGSRIEIDDPAGVPYALDFAYYERSRAQALAWLFVELGHAEPDLPQPAQATDGTPTYQSDAA